LLGASERLCEITSTPLPLVRREEYERVIAKARTQLDEADFIEAWTKGREMSVDQTMTVATGESAGISE
jgi:hypothetical protein